MITDTHCAMPALCGQVARSRAGGAWAMGGLGVRYICTATQKWKIEPLTTMNTHRFCVFLGYKLNHRYKSMTYKQKRKDI
jgi:hypothetical protein